MGNTDRERYLAGVAYDPVRRRVLRELAARSPPVSVRELTDAVTESTGEFDDSVVAQLHHVHVPKLDEAGLVTYDVTEQLVTEVTEEARLALEAYEQWTAVFDRASPETDETEAPRPSPAENVSDQKMTVIVDVELPADQFVLGDVVSHDAGIQIELERIVPLDHAILPFLWVSDGSHDAVEELLRSSEYVTTVTRLVTLEDRALYQLEWTQDVNGVIGQLEAAEGVIMEGHGRPESWSLRLRFTSHEQFKRFADGCREMGVDLTLRAVYNPHPPVDGGNLTSAQREAIRVASDRGYFKVPREVTLRELAEHFGVSEQAISQRLRRGLDTLVTGSINV